MHFSVWCGRIWLVCTESWPQPHPAALGWTGTKNCEPGARFTKFAKCNTGTCTSPTHWWACKRRVGLTNSSATCTHRCHLNSAHKSLLWNGPRASSPREQTPGARFQSLARKTVEMVILYFVSVQPQSKTRKQWSDIHRQTLTIRSWLTAADPLTLSYCSRSHSKYLTTTCSLSVGRPKTQCLAQQKSQTTHQLILRKTNLLCKSEPEQTHLWCAADLFWAVMSLQLVGMKTAARNGAGMWGDFGGMATVGSHMTPIGPKKPSHIHIIKKKERLYNNQFFVISEFSSWSLKDLYRILFSWHSCVQEASTASSAT